MKFKDSLAAALFPGERSSESILLGALNTAWPS